MAEDDGDGSSKPRYTLEKLEDLLEYNTVVDTVERFIQAAHGKKLTVQLIEKVVNPKLEERFKRRQGNMIGYSPETTKLKFHGTSSRALHKILGHGFKIPDSPGMFGRGIYFATDSSKSAQYSTDVTKLLLCEVALGKSLIVETADHSITYESLGEQGYDSVYAPRNTKKTDGVLFDEFVVYHKDQAVPRYCVTYTEENLQDSSDEEEATPYRDEPANAEYLPEGAVRWRKSAKSSHWSERYAYILHGRILSLFKNAQQCKASASAIHNDKKAPYEADPSIDVTEIDTIDVKEEASVKILIISRIDGTEELIAVDKAYEWMKALLSIRAQLRQYERAVQDYAEKDSDDEGDADSGPASAAPSASMSAFEARKAARKQKVGIKIDAKVSIARAVKDQVAIYDEVSGNYLGLLDNDEAIKSLPSEKSKMAVHKGMLAIKTDKSWKVVYCVIEGAFFIAYRSQTNEKGKTAFSEYKKLELDFAKIMRASHSFGKKIVPTFMIVVDNKPTMFCGKGVLEWVDYLQRFSGVGARELASQPLVSDKEKKRWTGRDSPNSQDSPAPSPVPSKRDVPSSSPTQSKKDSSSSKKDSSSAKNSPAPSKSKDKPSKKPKTPPPEEEGDDDDDLL